MYVFENKINGEETIKCHQRSPYSNLILVTLLFLYPLVAASIYSTTYLLPLSVLRLFLLFTVLPYHSYTGTAVKCPLIYRLFFGGTLVAVTLHMLVLSMLDPNSLRVFTPQLRRMLFLPHYDDDFYRRRHVWLLLSFSFASSLCHLIMLQHVTSTAPDQASALDRRRQLQQRRKSQPLFYYASRRWSQGRSEQQQQLAQQLHPERNALLPHSSSNNNNGHHENGNGDSLRRHHVDGNGDSNHLMDRISAQSYGTY